MIDSASVRPHQQTAVKKGLFSKLKQFRRTAIHQGEFAANFVAMA